MTSFLDSLGEEDTEPTVYLLPVEQEKAIEKLKKGVAEDDLKRINDELLHVFEHCTQLKTKAYELVVEDENDSETINEAKKLHQKLVKIRTGTDKRRKELKSPSLAYGKMIDGVAKVISGYFDPIEKHLKAQADFVKLKEEKELFELGKKRANEIAKAGGNPHDYDLTSLSESAYKALLKGVKADVEEAKAKAEAEENARKAEAEENARIKEENQALKKENEKLSSQKEINPQLHEATEVEEQKGLDAIVGKISKLWDERQIQNSTSSAQALCLVEEVGELAGAIVSDEESEIKDGIGDAVIVLNNIAKLQGWTLEECLEFAYENSKNRTGKFSKNGKWVKNDKKK